MTQKLQNNYSKRNSLTVKKILGPTTNFPTWGSGKGTENPQEIRLWRPVGFDYRTSIGLGKQTLGGRKQNCMCTRTQNKGAVTPQETEADLPVSVQEALVEAWVNSGLLQSWGTEYNSACTNPFEGGCHCLHYPYHNLASGQTTGRELSPTHQQKMGNSSCLKSHLLCL